MVRQIVVYIIVVSIALIPLFDDVSAKNSGFGSGSGKYSTFKSPKMPNILKAPTFKKGYSNKSPSIRSYRNRAYIGNYQFKSSRVFKVPRYRSSYTTRNYFPKPSKTFAFGSFAIANKQFGRVSKKAIDGDTFYSKGIRYRIRGIDTPERGQPLADAARQRLQQLLNSGNVEVRPVSIDKYGRTVAEVTVNGQDISDILKAEGFSK